MLDKLKKRVYNSNKVQNGLRKIHNGRLEKEKTARFSSGSGKNYGRY